MLCQVRIPHQKLIDRPFLSLAEAMSESSPVHLPYRLVIKQNPQLRFSCWRNFVVRTWRRLLGNSLPTFRDNVVVTSSRTLLAYFDSCRQDQNVASTFLEQIAQWGKSCPRRTGYSVTWLQKPENSQIAKFSGKPQPPQCIHKNVHLKRLCPAVPEYVLLLLKRVAAEFYSFLFYSRQNTENRCSSTVLLELCSI